MSENNALTQANLKDTNAGATSHVVTLIEGDGIGPEVTQAACRVIEAAGVKISWEVAQAGAKVFEAGIASGVPQETFDSLAKNRVALKGPLETPIGYGGKSANVTLRKYFETFGNIRPVQELPGVITPFSGRGIDLIVVRENVEDLYAGIEHMQTPDVAQCLKLISVKGCEKISQLTLELAKALGRKHISVATKANIMKKTEGMMKSVFLEQAKAYPEINTNHILIDNCAHQLVIKPEQFDIILTTNMNGDIISDLTSGLVGGLGLAPSANIGHSCSIFEAVHGSAPDIAGQDKANPIAIMLSSVMLLKHLGEMDAAYRIENAIKRTLAEAAAYPGDIAAGRPIIGTKAFTDVVIANLDGIPLMESQKAGKQFKIPEKSSRVKIRKPEERSVNGCDIFIEFDGSAEVLGSLLEEATSGTPFKLKMISNRGAMVYPSSGAETDCVDHWRCRFILTDGTHEDIPLAALDYLLGRVQSNGLMWMHIEKLYIFDGEAAYTMAQGEN